MSYTDNPSVDSWVSKYYGGWSGAAYSQLSGADCRNDGLQFYNAWLSGKPPATGNPGQYAWWYNQCTNDGGNGNPVPTPAPPDDQSTQWGVYAGAPIGAVLALIKTKGDARWTVAGMAAGAGAGWVLQNKLQPYVIKNNLLYTAIGGAAFGGLDLLFSAGENKTSAFIFFGLGAGYSWLVADKILPWANAKWAEAEQTFSQSHINWWGFLIPGYNLYEIYKLFSNGDITASGVAAEAAAAYTGIGVGYLLLAAGVLLNVSAVREKVVSLAGGGSGNSNLTSLLPLLLA